MKKYLRITSSILILLIITATPIFYIFGFVVPPNYDEWIARLHSREVMTDEEFANRKQSAILELQTALEADFYAFVVNNTVEQAARDIEDTRLNGIDQERQEHGRRAAQAILDELTAR